MVHLINFAINFLWNSVRNKSFTKLPCPGVFWFIAWFLNITSSSQRFLTWNVPGTVVLTPAGVCWPRAAARLSNGLPVAISASREAASLADWSRSTLAFSSARSRLIFSSSRNSSAVSSSSSESSSLGIFFQCQFG